MNIKPININVFSEYGKLEGVILHRPGKEFVKVDPHLLSQFLIEDTLSYEEALQESQVFVDLLQKNGTQVYFFEDLLAEVLSISEVIKTAFIDEFIELAIVAFEHKSLFREFLMNQPTTKDLINQVISGTLLYELQPDCNQSNRLKYITMPVVNALFTRDPAFVIGSTIFISQMARQIRKPETLMHRFVFQHHPAFVNATVLNFDDHPEVTIEGGDVMVFNENTVFIGQSERTNKHAAKVLAQKLFATPNNKINKVVSVRLDADRSIMHLDTLFTRIGKHNFNLYNAFVDVDYTILEITPQQSQVIKTSLWKYVKNIVGDDINFIKPHTKDYAQLRWEQWNDGQNMLAVRPDVTISYECNKICNASAEAAGVKVLKLPASTLIHARGGPRCMSLPICRELNTTT